MRAAEAARHLGVSVKALRLYEARGLILQGRTGAGWRSYGPAEMARLEKIVGLRKLGFGLSAIAALLEAGPEKTGPALAAQEEALEAQRREIGRTIGAVRRLRTKAAPNAPQAKGGVSFSLPWPWGGEPFFLDEIRPLTFIVGPLGSGKTRLAMRLAEAIAGATFVGLGRLAEDGTAVRKRLSADAALAMRVERRCAELATTGARSSAALTALLAALEEEGPAAFVVDMVEQGLDAASQRALISHLRARKAGARPLFLMTRSSAILDLAETPPDERTVFCPANHSPPILVAPIPGTPGYEALESCLASPSVRARTEGVVAIRPQIA
nr:MerR family transcriptional regulator [Afifella sp. IM 167]